MLCCIGVHFVGNTHNMRMSSPWRQAMRGMKRQAVKVSLSALPAPLRSSQYAALKAGQHLCVIQIEQELSAQHLYT